MIARGRGFGAAHRVASWVLVVALGATACGRSTDVGTEPSETDIAQSVARLAGTACLRPIIASAVVVGEGLLLTVAHAVAGAEDDLRVITPDGAEHGVVVVGFDPERDLALLFAESLDAPVLLLGTAAAEDIGVIASVTSGLDVEMIEYRVRRRVNARSGNIYREGTVERAALDLEAAITAGVSGAALINGEGAIAGVVYAASTELDSVTYALETSEISAFLESVDVETAVDRGRCR